MLAGLIKSHAFRDSPFPAVPDFGDKNCSLELEGTNDDTEAECQQPQEEITQC